MKSLPKNIIFYRDGVGEGQVPEVEKVELTSLIQLLEKQYGAFRPRVMFVVVTKRVDDRFSINLNNGLYNPDPGTIINRDVTMENRYHFFMVS